MDPATISKFALLPAKSIAATCPSTPLPKLIHRVSLLSHSHTDLQGRPPALVNVPVTIIVVESGRWPIALTLNTVPASADKGGMLFQRPFARSKTTMPPSPPAYMIVSST